MARKTARPSTTYYTDKEVSAYKARILREHQREQIAHGQDLYAQGVTAGRRAVIEAVIDLLGLDARFIRRDR